MQYFLQQEYSAKFLEGVRFIYINAGSPMIRPIIPIKSNNGDNTISPVI